MTIDELRKFKGLENCNDEEAEKIIEFLNHFCRIVFEYIRECEVKEIE